jgi:hypothetical protein
MGPRKLSPNCDQGVCTVGARKPKVHQRYIGPMKTELRHSLHRICRLRNKKHVLLRTDDRSQSLAEDRMILDAQDANWIGANHGMP